MPIETIDDICEWLADTFGIYSCHDPACQQAMDHECEGHPDACWCRMCFRMELKRRIYAAIAVEHRLDGRNEELLKRLLKKQ